MPELLDFCDDVIEAITDGGVADPVLTSNFLEAAAGKQKLQGEFAIVGRKRGDIREGESPSD
jgi:hypothetical protein